MGLMRIDAKQRARIVPADGDPDAAEWGEVYAFNVSTDANHPELAVRWGGREVATHELPIAQAIPYTIIKVSLLGSGVFKTEDEEWEIEPGMAFWFTPGIRSTLVAYEGTKLASYVIFLCGDGMQRRVKRYLHEPVGAIELTDPDPVVSIMEEIMLEGRGAGDTREENCADLARVLLRRIDSQMYSPIQANKLARKTFRTCRKHIEDHFADISMLAQVAEQCGVTVPYLCRLFDQFHDSSPYEYVTKLKLSKAERLLLSTDSKVKDIATSVGYKDLQLFSRNFKAAYDLSPSQFRKAHF